ncbi:MAG: hypothetical protein IJ343_15980 [Clostridia bacterium]|nr:hypothetical protein [Clostridia bacterium]
MKITKAKAWLWLKKNLFMTPGRIILFAGLFTLVTAILYIIMVVLWNSDPSNPFGVYAAAPAGATLEEAIDLAAESGILSNWLPRELLFLRHRYIFVVLGLAEMVLGYWLRKKAADSFLLEELFIDDV